MLKKSNLAHLMVGRMMNTMVLVFWRYLSYLHVGMQRRFFMEKTSFYGVVLDVIVEYG